MLRTISMISDDMFDYDRACEYMEDAAKLGSRPGLDRISALCSLLGDPQDELRFIHIAGTNGKGSTACFIASVLSEAGVRTGMYTSPAVCGIRDHYRINGELISETDYADCVSAVAAANEELIAKDGDGATQFELETAVAFTYFRDKRCDVVVLECGMGGRADATNIVKNKLCCVITSVSYDHMQYLGDTPGAIAAEKSGIISCDCPVIALDTGGEVIDVIKNRCEQTGSRLFVVDPSSVMYRMVRDDASIPSSGMMVDIEDFSDIKIALSGTFQAVNAALALKALSVLKDTGGLEGFSISEDDIRAGFAKARWPYRFECISTKPLVYVDGAHNADAAQKLRDTIRQYFDGYNTVLILGVFADKQYEKVVATLAGTASRILTVETPDNPRALPAKELAKCARKYHDDVRACGSIEEAYRAAKAAAEDEAGRKTVVVACGSLSYLDKFARIVRGY